MLDAVINTIRIQRTTLSLHVTLRGRTGIIRVKGPNGSGKTSLLEAIAGIRRFSGYSKISGFDLGGSPADYKLRLGYVPARYDFFDGMSGSEYLDFVAHAYGTPREYLSRAIDSLGLAPHAKQRIRQMSYGTVKKLLLVAGTGHDPDVLLLDEPLNGLDSESRRYLDGYVKSNLGNKLFVVVSHDPHWMAEQTSSEVVLGH